MNWELCSQILHGGSRLVAGISTVRAFSLYPALPADANIPIKFGLWGEVIGMLRWKPAYWMYPAISLVGSFSSMVWKPRPSPPPWVTDVSLYNAMSDCMHGGVMLSTSLFLLVAVEQIPRITRGEQKQLLPETLTAGYLGALAAVMGGFWFGIRYAQPKLSVD
eukprot:gnl/TRDRNA2_/TRDRNA2_134379_c0_seq1.p1 gnl/TRDRNA2_/TRDRNA2_134379_c0~~gnl/TRDRNA2_/TRDRNA2_134379_c0_seq1.p1  ORF type:complete len:163 (+),score=13.14 gnl/TRDRNA2_/TRDRNA2_134379_c0_seq1:84-572(+)